MYANLREEIEKEQFGPMGELTDTFLHESTAHTFAVRSNILPFT